MNQNLITGMGLISAAGFNLDENYQNFMKKQNGIQTVTRFELPVAKVKTNFAGLIPKIPIDIIPSNITEQLGKDDLGQDYVKSAVSVVSQAIEDAGIADEIRNNPRRTALIVASSLGNFLNISALVKDYFMKDLYKITSLINGMNSYLPSRLGSLLGIQGPCYFVSSSCTSSLNALLQADTMVKSGVVDRVVICSVDVCLETGTYHLWNKIRVLSRRNDTPKSACRPYCKTRDGIVIGEAAACFVVESPAVAKKKGYAKLEGFGMCNGATDFLKPTPSLLENAIREALQVSNTSIDQIDFIIGSASGSPHCDHFESEVICRIFGEYTDKVPLFSYKSFFGSTFGVQALSEGALAMLSMKYNEIPEVRNIFEPDERVKANAYYDFKEYKGYDIKRMLFINYGFAGNHMATVYSKP